VGKRYYFCEISAMYADAKRTEIVAVTVVAKPVITILSQPVAPETLPEGAIPANTRLTVSASVTENATLLYQWYRNTSESNSGGNKLIGETAASYTLPTDLTEGEYYYYCEISALYAETKYSAAVKVSVAKPSVDVEITAPGDGEKQIDDLEDWDNWK
jgi:hypothetical protein